MYCLSSEEILKSDRPRSLVRVPGSNLKMFLSTGRSVRLRTSDGDWRKLGKLSGLALEAGFDWVEYTSDNYIRASVIPDGES